LIVSGFCVRVADRFAGRRGEVGEGEFSHALHEIMRGGMFKSALSTSHATKWVALKQSA
jgi:hypothetical protein